MSYVEKKGYFLSEKRELKARMAECVLVTLRWF